MGLTNEEIKGLQDKFNPLLKEIHETIFEVGCYVQDLVDKKLGSIIKNSRNYPIEVRAGGDCYNSNYTVSDIIEGLKYGWLKLSDERIDEHIVELELLVEGIKKEWYERGKRQAQKELRGDLANILGLSDRFEPLENA